MTGLETTLAILSGIKKLLKEISETMSEELTTKDKENIKEWKEWTRTCYSLVSREFEQMAQKEGRWKPNCSYEPDYYTCSVCDNDFTLIDGSPKDNGYNFCPSCGAKMKGGNNDK